ncbi:phosphotransferase family protein [Microlunatus parietis]|uniref:Ser/Thr protein kinase RdoA (MazF antagonist) n=1 Tax=Microlunatus parietis TaxID=682979 RepID=A0A7Y9LEU5_9ACTN|nr:aminoglycoside phosphotransferase family protein [Microlunatus parietis]NYE74188.1 Ser/Thr protein kinase RdoA (MazF antagonist) [Microlunatus parietis]
MRIGSFGEWQLAQPSTPRSVLADVVRRAVGAEILRADRILEGYSNEVYRVRAADDQDLMIRILRFDDDISPSASAAEARAIALARAAGVPAPEILLLDTIDAGDRGFPVMVQRTVPGRPLSQVIERLSEQQVRQVLIRLGELMARLNGIRVESELDWSTVMAAGLADRCAKRDQVLAGGFSATEFDQIIELLAGYVRDFPVEEWVLCHGDLSGKHIFVTGDGGDSIAVTGMIDFGDWQAGAPVHDLAVLRVREPQLEVSPLLLGFGAPADETYRRRLDLHTLLIALDSLTFGVDQHDPVGIARSGRQVRSLVSDLG